MRLIEADNAEAYLRETGRIPPAARMRVETLTGGVSNRVLRVWRLDAPGEDFVVKQARGQLATPDAWYCTVERIWREVDVLRTCAALAPPGWVPRILLEDRDNYLFAMTAAPREHAVWKRELLAGRVDPAIAASCGQLLARLHAGTWQDAAVAERLGDRAIFDELRLDPYYRATAREQPDAKAALDRLIESVMDHPRCLTHADFSPKNLLVFDGGLMLVDYETGHFGDPAFDLGFFLSHLVLKAFERAGECERYFDLTERFWDAYREVMAPRVDAGELTELEARAALNFAGCAWARLDGKSKIDYLGDACRRDAVRGLCRGVLAEQPATWTEVLDHCRAALRRLGFAAESPV